MAKGGWEETGKCRDADTRKKWHYKVQSALPVNYGLFGNKSLRVAKAVRLSSETETLTRFATRIQGRRYFPKHPPPVA